MKKIDPAEYQKRLDQLSEILTGIAMHATEAVGEWLRHVGQVRGITSSSSPADTPSPSGRTASALAAAIAAS